MRSVVVLIGFLASIALGAPTEAAERPIRQVKLASIEGLPPDLPSRRAFLEGFRSAFAERELKTVSERGPGSLAHGFVLRDSVREPHWELQVVIGAPPLLRDIVRDKKGKLISQKPNGRRASRGMTLVLTALSPEAIEAGARPVPERIGLVLPESAGTEAQQVNTRGVEYRWDLAGIAVGRYAIEALLRVAEGAEAEWRADLSPVLRLPSPRP